MYAKKIEREYQTGRLYTSHLGGWLFYVNFSLDCHTYTVTLPSYTGKKGNKIFHIYREIQMESGAKSFMRKGFLIYEEMHKYIHNI
jgi:hypothetical protein